MRPHYKKVLIFQSLSYTKVRMRLAFLQVANSFAECSAASERGIELRKAGKWHSRQGWRGVAMATPEGVRERGVGGGLRPNAAKIRQHRPDTALRRYGVRTSASVQGRVATPNYRLANTTHAHCFTGIDQ